MAVVARALWLLPLLSAAWCKLVPAVWALWTQGWSLALLLALPTSFADTETRQQLLGKAARSDWCRADASLACHSCRRCRCCCSRRRRCWPTHAHDMRQ